MTDSRSGGPDLVTLTTDRMTVTLTPGRGLDLYEIVDARTGVDVLFKTPWGRKDPAAFPPLGTRMADWLAAYPGGWQVLLPTAGGERARPEAPEGFHGEASVAPWTVEEVAASSCRASVDLVTAPLRVERVIRLEGARLILDEAVTNLSPDPQPYHWVHHPAFGAPLLGPGTQLEVPAVGLVTGGDGEPGALHAWPTLDRDGESLDLSRIPERDRPRALFGTLVGFTEGRYRIRNAALDLAVEVRWDLDVFPYAWFWQELEGSEGYPWFRRAYVTAIEPATVIPGTGATGGFAHGVAREIAGGERIATTLELELLTGGAA